MERKIYIDVAKGIAMLLVVMQHTGGMLDSGMRLLCKVDVPLFFVCSGYLAYKAQIDVWVQFKKYIRRILIPFIFACIAASIIFQESIIEIFTSYGKRGYWFLEALFIMLALFMLIYKDSKRLIIGGLLIEFFLLLASKFAPVGIDSLLVFSYMSRYFPCLIIGALLRKHTIDQLPNLWIGSILVIISFMGLGIDYASTNISFLAHVIGYSSASLLAFLFIKNYTNRLSVMLQKSFAYIGQYSLNVYIIHFYFVQSLPFSWGGWFILDFISVLILAVVVIIVSIAVGKFLTCFTYLNKILTP